MHNVFIGRQPIYDNKLDVFAYELLFRSGEVNNANFTDGDHATTEVILNTFTEIGLDKIVGKHLAFINLTRSFILGEYPLPDIKDRIVLEFMEDIEVDAEIITALHNLANQGYTIALDDFIYHEDLQPLVDIAKIIKIDLLALERETLVSHVKIFRNNDTKLLAEKVETQEDFEFCKSLGFDYFQGYFFSRPNIIKGQRSPASRVATMRLLAKLNEPSTDIHTLEEIIAQDMALSIRLLRYINSAHFALNVKVDSVKHAITMLGLNAVRTLATLLAFSRIHDKPYQLMITSLLRAKMCELVAEKIQANNKESYFTVGLFSVIDAIMDRPMKEIMEELPLSDLIKMALLSHTGEIGHTLKCVIAYDLGEWDAIHYSMGIAPEILFQSYLDAITWAGEIGKALTQH